MQEDRWPKAEGEDSGEASALLRLGLRLLAFELRMYLLRAILEWDGGFGGRMDTGICTAVSLRCSSESTTTLFIGCTPIQGVFVLKKKRKEISVVWVYSVCCLQWQP